MIIQPDKRRESGIALIVVLWFLVLLTGIAMSVAGTSRTEMQLARNLVQTAQARQAALAGIQRAILELQRLDFNQAWPADGSVHELRLDKAVIRIGITDETGKIDINHAPTELLLGLMQATGIESDAALVLVDALLDWRDDDHLRRLRGAEDEDYRRAGRNYGAKDAFFDNIRELQQVLGITPTSYRKLAPYITVHSGKKGIDSRFAQQAVLLAVPGIDPTLIEEILSLRQEGATGTLHAPLVSSSGYLTPSDHKTYSVHVEARTADNAISAIDATLRRSSRSAAQPFRVLDWKQSENIHFFTPLPSSQIPDAEHTHE